MKNAINYLSWQGTHIPFSSAYRYGAILLVLITLGILFLTKDLIRSRFARGGKFLFFKNDMVMWQTVGGVYLALEIFRLIFNILGDYTGIWENLSLHVCRLHMLIISLLLIFRRVNWIKYLTYIIIISVFFAFIFYPGRSIPINEFGMAGGASSVDPNVFIANWQLAHPGYVLSNFEINSIKLDVRFYNQGPDNFFFQETFFSHWFILFISVFVRCAYRYSYVKKEIYLTMLGYIIGASLIWIFNYLLDTFASNPRWWANNWYLGTDKANDMKNALGVLSAWPQSIFTYLTIAFFVLIIFHFIWAGLDKYHFFVDGKFIVISKSEHFAKLQQEFSTTFKFKNKKV